MSYWGNVREVKRLCGHAFAHFWEVTFAESPVLPQGEGGESEVCAADVDRRWGGRSDADTQPSRSPEGGIAFCFFFFSL